jgi:hypothetical protein
LSGANVNRLDRDGGVVGFGGGRFDDEEIATTSRFANGISSNNAII